MESIIILSVFFLIIVVVLLISRWVVIWYFKIDKMIKSLNRVNFNLEKIAIKLGCTDDDTIVVVDSKTKEEATIRINKLLSYKINNPKEENRYKIIKRSDQ